MLTTALADTLRLIATTGALCMFNRVKLEDGSSTRYTRMSPLERSDTAMRPYTLDWPASQHVFKYAGVNIYTVCMYYVG